VRDVIATPKKVVRTVLGNWFRTKYSGSIKLMDFDPWSSWRNKSPIGAHQKNSLYRVGRVQLQRSVPTIGRPCFGMNGADLYPLRLFSRGGRWGNGSVVRTFCYTCPSADRACDHLPDFGRTNASPHNHRLRLEFMATGGDVRVARSLLPINLGLLCGRLMADCVPVPVVQTPPYFVRSFDPTRP